MPPPETETADRAGLGVAGRWKSSSKLSLSRQITRHCDGAERLLAFPSLKGDLVHHGARAGFERPWRLHELAAIDPEAYDFLAGQDVHFLELHRPDEVEQGGAAPILVR